MTMTGNDHDDWEVAVDTGEFDKRLEQLEKDRAATQESILPSTLSTNDNDNRNFPNLNQSNKPIRILKRPTNDFSNSNVTTSTTNNEMNSPFFDDIPSTTTTTPVISIIPRNQSKESIINTSSTQSTKPQIKTYEQREQEYRLARLRIMGEEESSAKDDDDDTPAVDVPPSFTDDNTRIASSSTTRSTNKMSGFSQPPLLCHSTPGSYAADLYSLNNVQSNTGTIHFTPNNNTNNNSTPNLGIGPFSSPNFPQHYRNPFTGPYSHILPATSGGPRYTLPVTTTNTLYMTSTAPFISAPPSSVSSSYHYPPPPPPPPPQHPNMATNNWYHYQHSHTSYGTQQYGHPQ